MNSFPKNISIRARKLAHLLLGFLPVITGFSFGRVATWSQINNKLDSAFPQVKNISTHELHDMLEEQENFVLLDVRAKEEFQISRISSALHVSTPTEVSYPKKTKIIIYCSVGYRSARIADRLRKVGFSNVFNLRGSIFEWANKGFLLIDGESPTFYVHPYNKKWGALLKPELHRYPKQKGIK